MSNSHLAFLEQRVLWEHKYPGSAEGISHKQRDIVAAPADRVSLAAPQPASLPPCLSSALTLRGKNIS